MHQLKFNRTLNDSSRPGVCGCDLISQSVALTHHLILNFWCTELWGVFRLSPSCFRGLRKARTKSQIQTYHGKFPDQKIIVKIDGFFLRPNITCLWLFKYQPTNYPPYCSRIKLVDASTGSFEVEMLKHRRRAIVIHYFDFTLHTLHSIFLTFELKAPPPPPSAHSLLLQFDLYCVSVPVCLDQTQPRLEVFLPWWFLIIDLKPAEGMISWNST